MKPIAPTGRARRPLLITVLASLLGLIAAAAFAAPAGAHSDDGEMTVTRAEESSPLTITVEVGVLYTDGHLAEEAEVLASASSEGTNLEPVRLERLGEGSSVYGAEISVPNPGQWSLTIQSTNPTASATSEVTVAEAPPSTTSSTAAPATTVADDAGETDDAGVAAGADGEESGPAMEDEGSSTGLIIGIVVAALVVIGGAVYVLRQRAARTDV